MTAPRPNFNEFATYAVVNPLKFVGSGPRG